MSLVHRLLFGGAVGAIATLAYRATQALTIDRATTRHECWTWQWCPFSPEWIWPYLSMFVLVGLPWFLLPDEKQVRRYAIVLLAVAATGWIVFLVHPTACVRPSPDGQPFYYQALLFADRPNNCMPCLHSAFPVLAAWALAHGSRIGRTVLVRFVLFAWVGVICFSIVALRQHTDIDMLAGLVLGAIGAWAWTRVSAPGNP